MNNYEYYEYSSFYDKRRYFTFAMYATELVNTCNKLVKH